MQKLIFRVDGSTEIGLGHLYRCYALANMLDKQFECQFHTCTKINSILQLIGEKYALVSLDESNHFEDFIASLSGDEIVVLDNYFFTTEYQKKIKAIGCKLVCIDDIHDRHFVADLVLNHAPGIAETNYSCDPSTTLLLGLDYVLLRQPFLKLAQQDVHAHKSKVLLICFGGSDTLNITYRIVNSITENTSIDELHVIIGAGYTQKVSLEKLIRKLPFTAHLHEGLSTKEMIDVISKSSAAIVPSSTILFEVLVAKIPVITGKYVENQKNISAYFKQLGSIGEVVDFEQDEVNNQLIDTLMNFKGEIPVLIDGFSSHRILNEFLRLSTHPKLTWRTAQMEDVDLYYNWANDPIVRESGYQTDRITYVDHVAWYASKVDSSATFMQLFLIDGVPAGQVRLGIENGEATIGISIAPDFRGMKLASAFISIAINELQIAKKELIKVWAFIKLSNEKSVKSFVRAGFKEMEQREISGCMSYVLSYQADS